MQICIALYCIKLCVKQYVDVSVKLLPPKFAKLYIITMLVLVVHVYMAAYIISCVPTSNRTNSELHLLPLTFHP